MQPFERFDPTAVRHRLLRQREAARHRIEALAPTRAAADWFDESAECSGLAGTFHETVTHAEPALADSSTLELCRIEAALARLDRGEYGRCVACDAPIERGRLNADPAMARCERCETPGAASR